MTHIRHGKALREFRAICPVTNFMASRVCSRATALTRSIAHGTLTLVERTCDSRDAERIWERMLGPHDQELIKECWVYEFFAGNGRDMETP